jgi:ammonia channel protein AmtB
LPSWGGIDHPLGIAVLLWSPLMSFVLAKGIQAFADLRVSGDTEEQGLDLRVHGERGYIM